MSSQLSAHAITAHTAMTRISVSRCSTLPAHRGSASAEKCSTSFSTDIAILPSSIKGEPAQPVSPSEPARPFHASPLGCSTRAEPQEPTSSVNLSFRIFQHGLACRNPAQIDASGERSFDHGQELPDLSAGMEVAGDGTADKEPVCECDHENGQSLWIDLGSDGTPGLCLSKRLGQAPSEFAMEPMRQLGHSDIAGRFSPDLKAKNCPVAGFIL